MAINGRALAAASLGGLFIWSGIKGWSVLGTIGDLIKGQMPDESVAYPLTIGTGGNSGSSVSSGSGTSGIAGIALQYQGHAYLFGGAPGPDGTKPWDCSSFVNYVVGVKAGKAIPGNAPGTYNGTYHGPPTGVWAAWTGMDTVKRADVQAGDIIVWIGHMGIAINNTQVVSALNPRATTRITGIDKGTHTPPIVRIGRLR